MSWRASMFAFAAMVCLAGGALAHALPGSVLSLRLQGGLLQLTLQFPVEDLIIAAPEFVALEDVEAGQSVSEELTDELTRYLSRHLSVSENGVSLDLNMTDVRLQPAHLDHLGQFTLLVSQWEMMGAEKDSTPLELSYDAVMHEVRNHRATVQWIEPNGDLRLISEFGYFDAANGVLLDLRAVGRQ